MNAASDVLASGRGGTVERVTLPHLAAGTLAVTDLAAARVLYEDFLGLECVEYAPRRMLARDRRCKQQMQLGMRDFFVLDIEQVDAIENPQGLYNHWGFSVGSEAEVDRIRAIAIENAAHYGLRTIHPTTKMHGSYGFYMSDTDDNWWEIEYRRGATNDLMFSRGDWNADKRESFPIIDPELAIAQTHANVVGGEAFMTHGTTSVIDCNESRPFYEDILGLRTVWHARPAHCFAGGGDFAVVGVTTGAKVQEQLQINRFVLLVDDEAELESLRQKVEAASDQFGLRHLGAIADQPFGGRSFLLQTKDYVWFEVSTRSRQSYTEVFADR